MLPSMVGQLDPRCEENIKWGLFAKVEPEPEPDPDPDPDNPHRLHVRKIETLIRWDLLIDRKKALMFGVRYCHSLN